MSAQDIIVVTVLLFMFGTGFVAFYHTYDIAASTMINNSVINQSNTTTTVLEKSQDLLNRFDYIVFIVFIILAIMMILTSWFVAGNPIFTFIYFIIVVIAVAVSAVLSYGWETFGSGTFATIISNNFPITQHLLNNLPIYMSIIGFIGIVVMFGKPQQIQ